MARPDAGGGRAELPGSLTRLLEGTNLSANLGEAFALLTVSPAGWVHVALLGVGEILAHSPTELSLCLWPSSQTSANLERTGKGTLAIPRDGAMYYVRLVATPGQLFAEERCLVFQAKVEDVKVDEVDYATVTHGVGYALVGDKREILERWEATIAAMRRG